MTVCCLMSSSMMLAQPAAVLAQPAAVLAQPVAAKRPGGGNGVPAAVARKPAENRERRIYIPFRNWQTLTSKDDPTVFLPYSEYLRLVKQAQRATFHAPLAPPTGAVLTEAHYVGRVEADRALLSCTFTVRTLQEGWSEVPLRFGNAAIGKFTGANGKAILRGVGDGRYLVMLPSRGTHTVTLNLTVTVNKLQTGREFSFECPSVGISTFDLTVPEPGQSIIVLPGLTPLSVARTEKTVARTGKTSRVRVGLNASRKITARWFPKTAAQPHAEPLATVQDLIRVNVSKGLLLSETQLTYEVHQGEVREIRLAVPLSHRILDISSSAGNIAGWTDTKQATHRVVTIKLPAPVSDRLTIHVTTERTLSGETFSPAGRGADKIDHGVHALGVIRESGFLIINHDEATTLTMDMKSGWSRVRADVVPATHRAVNAIYYRFYNLQTALTVTVHAVKPRIIAKQDAELTLTTEEIRLRTNFDFTVEQAGVFELTLRLPKGLTVDSVQAAGMKEYRVDGSDGVDGSDATDRADGQRILRVAFSQKVLGNRRVTVVAHAKPIPPGPLKPQPVPLPSVVAAVIESGRIRLFAPASLAVIVENAVANGLSPGELTPVRTESTWDVRPVSVWNYHRQPITLSVRIDRVPTRLSARVGTTVQIREDGMRVSTRLEYTIEHSPLNSFRILVEKSLLDSLRIQNAEGKSVPFKSAKPGQPNLAGPTKKKKKQEQKKKDKKNEKKEKEEKPLVVDNWRVVTFEVPKPILGKATFLLTSEIAAERNGEETAGASPRQILAQPIRVADVSPVVNFPVADDSSFIPVSQLFGEVAVLADPSFKVTAERKAGDDVESIDSREVRFVPRGNGLYFRYHQEPVSISIRATKLKIQQVVQTVIAKALVEAVIGRDKTATFRCRYRIVTSERQRLRVDLPKPAETLSVLVNGKSVNLELNTNAKNVKEDFRSFLVSVSRTETSARSLSLTLQFRLPVTPAPFEGALGKLRLFFPKIGEGDSSATVVQQLRTVIWIPREYVLVGNVDGFARRTWTRLKGVLPNQFSADSDSDPLEEWIGVGTGGGFEFPHDGHAYRFDNLGGSEQLEVSFADLSFSTWVASIALLLIAWVLSKTSWENKLAVLLLLGFLAALLSLNDMDWVYHGLIVTRYGLVAMLVWWIIRSAFGLSRHVAPRDSRRPATGGPPIAMYASIVAAVIPPPGVFTAFISAARKTKSQSNADEASRTDG